MLAEWTASGALVPRLGLGGWIAFALLIVPAALGLLAVREFARVGGGTPFPWDSPKRLVTSGPYAYVANPMQIAGSLSLLIWSIVLVSPIVALAAVNATVFAAGLARYSEQADLEARFGEPWRAYRREVGDWWPRRRAWRPQALEGSRCPSGRAGATSAVEALKCDWPKRLSTEHMFHILRPPHSRAPSSTPPAPLPPRGGPAIPPESARCPFQSPTSSSTA